MPSSNARGGPRHFARLSYSPSKRRNRMGRVSPIEDRRGGGVKAARFETGSRIFLAALGYSLPKAEGESELSSRLRKEGPCRSVRTGR